MPDQNNTNQEHFTSSSARHAFNRVDELRSITHSLINEARGEMKMQEHPGIILDVDYAPNNSLYVKWICGKAGCDYENTVEATEFPLVCKLCGNKVDWDKFFMMTNATQGIWHRVSDHINTVGVTFENEEGNKETNRQVLIHKLSKEAILVLLPEPDNPYDKNAVAIYHKADRLGFMPKDYFATHDLDPNKTFITKWSKVGGGETTNYGLLLTISTLRSV